MFRWRTFLWAVMIALAVGAFYYGDRSIQYGDKLALWKTANIAQFPIDLSKAGSYDVPLELITDTPCKVFFYVQIDGDVPLKRDLLGGLSGMIIITDDQKKEICKLPVNAENCDDWPQNTGRLLPLIWTHPWGMGHYQMRLNITGSSSKLKGIRHSLVVKYDLCGIEYGVQMVLRAIAAFFCLACLIIGLYLFSTRRRPSVVHEPEQESV